MSTIFEVVAEPTRRRILDDVRDDERGVGELVERLGLSQPGVSKHLRVLREAGLVEVRQVAQRRLYRARPEPLVALDAWLAPYRQLWSDRLDALERHLDEVAETEKRGNEPEPDVTRPDGRLEEIDGRHFLLFERRFAHPVERVWDALTRPEQLGKWLCGTSDMEIELVEGGTFAFRITGPPDLVAMIGDDLPTVQWIVRRVEPPLLFEHSFTDDPGSFARYELQPDGDGCRLLLSVAVPSRESALEGQFLVGWHMSLEALEQVLVDEPSTWTLRRFDELRTWYATKG